MKNNCYIYDSDTFRTRIYDRNTTIEFFGEDYLEDYGYYIPDELLNEYNRLNTELNNIISQIDKLVSEQNKKRI